MVRGDVGLTVLFLVLCVSFPFVLGAPTITNPSIGMFGFSWLVIGAVLGGVFIFLIVLILLIRRVRRRRRTQQAAHESSVTQLVVPSMPESTHRSQSPSHMLNKRSSVTPYPGTLSSPNQSPQPQQQMAQQSAWQTTQPQGALTQFPAPTPQGQGHQSLASNSFGSPSFPSPKQFSSSQPMQPSPSQQSPQNVQFVKYYAQNLSHDARVRIKYLLSAGEKFASAGDVISAKQVYAYIFEEYNSLSYHDELLYNQIIAFKQKIG